MPLSGAAQAEHKRSLVIDAFTAAGVEAQVAPVVSAAETLGYRSKVVLVAREVRGRTIFGGYQRGSHFVLDLDGCVIEEPILTKAAQWMRRSLARVPAFNERWLGGDLRYVSMRSTAAGEALVTWIGGRQPKWASEAARDLMADVPGVRGVLWAENRALGNAIWGTAPARVLSGSERVIERVHGLSFAISPRAFFQVHRAQASVLREAIANEVSTGDVVWDLYCGVGVNALLLASRGAKVCGVESVPEAVADAEANARDNSLSARFVLASLEANDWAPDLETPQVVVVNPPRKGAPQSLIERIAAAQPAKIVYVACAPKPLAQAAAWLVGRASAPANYRLRSVTPYDLFPHTEQVETLAVFERM